MPVLNAITQCIIVPASLVSRSLLDHKIIIQVA